MEVFMHALLELEYTKDLTHTMVTVGDGMGN